MRTNENLTAMGRGGKSTRKAESLAKWAALDSGQNPLPKMEPIPYKTRGSRYGACGIRIDGSPEFIDAVLSNLKALLDGENCITRLELARHTVDGSGIGKALPNAVGGAEVCYIRLHVRGHEGQRASMVFDRHLHGATERYAEMAGGR